MRRRCQEGYAPLVSLCLYGSSTGRGHEGSESRFSWIPQEAWTRGKVRNPKVRADLSRAVGLVSGRTACGSVKQTTPTVVLRNFPTV